MDIEKLRSEAQSIVDAAESENRPLTDVEQARIGEILDTARKMRGLETVRKSLAELTPEPVAEPVRKGGRLSDQVLESPEFKSWFRQVAPRGYIPESAKGLSSPPVRVESKTLITGSSSTSAGAFTVAEDSGLYEPLGRYNLGVLQLISRRQTTSDAVEFVRQTTAVSEAAPVPESNVTTYTGGSGEVKGDKPEGTMAFERVNAPVRTIAVWVAATKRALSDASQLRGIIDQDLRGALEAELVDQIINGTGTGENFTGIMNDTGVLDQAYTTDVFTTCRLAIVNMAQNGLATPTAWLFNPADWATLELTTDINGRYLMAGPGEQGPARLWGVPVAFSFYVPQGTAILGDWRKAVLWDREESTVTMSDSHSDFFIRNMVAILAELRAAFGLLRPSAFVRVDLEAGT